MMHLIGTDLILAIVALLFGDKAPVIAGLILKLWVSLAGGDFDNLAEHHIIEFALVVTAFGICLIGALNHLFLRAHSEKEKHRKILMDTTLLSVAALLSISEEYFLKGLDREIAGQSIFFFCVFIGLIMPTLLFPSIGKNVAQRAKNDKFRNISIVVVVSMLIGAISKQVVMYAAAKTNVFALSPNIDRFEDFVNRMRDHVRFEIDTYIIVGAMLVALAYYELLFQSKKGLEVSTKTITLYTAVAFLIGTSYAALFEADIDWNQYQIINWGLITGYGLVAITPVICPIPVLLHANYSSNRDNLSWYYLSVSFFIIPAVVNYLTLAQTGHGKSIDAEIILALIHGIAGLCLLISIMISKAIVMRVTTNKSQPIT